MRFGWVGLACLAACGTGTDAGPRVLSASGATMGTTYALSVVGDDEAAFTAAVQAVEALLLAVNQRFSTYIADSTISRLNAHRSTEPFPVDAEFAAVLGLALRIAAASGGAYDPTVLPLVRALDFGPEADEVAPTAAELAAARALVDYRRVELLDGPAVRKADLDLEIDLSSIAKGAGVDRVSDLLAARGFAGHMVEIGGEVRCRGRKPDGSAWRIGVERPGSDAGRRAVLEAVEVVDRAIATSGSYRNFHRSGGVEIHHVLDARTGVNAPNGVVSVSVDAPDCSLADGLATALMVVGPEEASTLLAAFPGLDLRVLFLLAGAGGEVREVRIGWPAPR
jgi:thiamine biosynthesis lipoprotein